jgi:hypothetical protein
MAGKYRIKKSNLKEFFGLFSKKRTPADIQNIIDKDPVLKNLKNDIDKINQKYKPNLDKMKKNNPKLFASFQKAGMIPMDYE